MYGLSYGVTSVNNPGLTSVFSIPMIPRRLCSSLDGLLHRLAKTSDTDRYKEGRALHVTTRASMFRYNRKTYLPFCGAQKE